VVGMIVLLDSKLAAGPMLRQLRLQRQVTIEEPLC